MAAFQREILCFRVHANTNADTARNPLAAKNAAPGK
jgi:hypothetical protein